MFRYSDLRPEELDSHWSRGAPAIVPFGALEWHGPHLPLGLDGIVAERFSEGLAERLQGVILPCFWTPITTIPHRHSLQAPTQAVRMLLDETLSGLYRSGARTTLIVSGHYADGHAVEMCEAALRAMEDLADYRVFVGTPLEALENGRFLDHAGRYETSQLMAVRPELAHVGALPEQTTPKQHAVIGQSPSESSADEGVELTRRALEQWAEWVMEADRESLFDHYRTRFDRYEEYMDAYYDGSWERAILKWWEKLD
jgi:creatinine amidohydrolase